MAKKKKKKLKIKFKVILFILIIIILITCTVFYLKKPSLSNNSDFYNSVSNQVKEYIDKYNKYQVCLNEKYSESDLTDNLNDKINQVKEIIAKYNVSLYYYNPENEFSLTNKKDATYYAASTIKMLDALYIYKNADEGNLDLNDKATYKSSNYLGASKGMKKYKFGSKVALKELVKYAILYSDNTAHSILVDYIGKGKLKSFGNSLGAKNTLVGDIFGSISAEDSYYYLKALYEYFETNTENSKELKKIFIDSDQNYLNLPELNIDAAVKYGEYPPYYHENGIVFSQNPYLISILSTIGNNEKAFREINKNIYELNNTFYTERENRCKKIIEQ